MVIMYSFQDTSTDMKRYLFESACDLGLRSDFKINLQGFHAYVSICLDKSNTMVSKSFLLLMKFIIYSRKKNLAKNHIDLR